METEDQVSSYLGALIYYFTSYTYHITIYYYVHIGITVRLILRQTSLVYSYMQCM
jgi:hypothetical protein